MIDLIRKRHPGEGWIVFEELASGTGARPGRWADAAALGVWPSNKYELHGYEVKRSREDLKREIRDPTKADAIGKYCHFWWLVLADEVLMDGLAVPQPWGILVPRRKILRTVRKAPRVARPRAFDPGFCAAMIRNITNGWVSPAEHARVRDATYAGARADVEAEIVRAASTEDRALRELRDKVTSFKEESGIDLQAIHHWEIGDVSRAVKALVRAQRIGRGHKSSLAEIVRREALTTAHFGERHREAARTAAAAAQQMLELAGRLEVDEEAALAGEAGEVERCSQS